MDKTVHEKCHEYNQQSKDMDWFQQQERMTTTLKYSPTGESVKIVLEGRGGLNKDIRDIILTTGFDWHQGRSLSREPISEEK